MVFYLGLRLGLFSSVHSFVSAMGGPRQGAATQLAFIALLAWAGAWPRSARLDFAGLALLLGLNLLGAAFAEDFLGWFSGLAWLRSSL